jgi:arylformamidase
VSVANFIDLSHPIEEDMPMLAGLPPPVVRAVFTREASRPRYEGRAEFLIGRFELAANTGTYLDAPFHRYVHGADLGALGLERLAGLPGLVLDGRAGKGRAVDVDASPEELKGRAVLVRTRWDATWGSAEYFTDGPFLSAAALDTLVVGGPALVGVDFSNVDDTNDPSRPAHTRLLAAGILIVENLRNLSALPIKGFEFDAVPPAILGGASFPVRAFARVLDGS